jgi:23S rRNA (uracil1939-C5)-methyltransferase
MKRHQAPPKPPPAARSAESPILVQIEKPIYGGAFLARVGGKAIFVPLTLPGEQARVRIVEDKGGYATAEAEEIVTPAPVRIAPRCPYFGACGGCHYQHAGYATQLALKQAVLRETLERSGVLPPAGIDILAAEPESRAWAYRNRIRLAFDDAGDFGYRGRRSHSIIPIHECPIASPLLIDAARAAREIASGLAPAMHPMELSLFCNAEETALLASIFTAGTAKSAFAEFVQTLAERVPALRGAAMALDGRPGKPARTIAQWGAPFITYRAAGFGYRVDHGAFFQVNRWIIDALVERVTAGHAGALAWDLFAGVGLFARKLASSFAHVIAVESAPAAIPALESNLAATSASAVRADSLDFLRSNRKSERPDLIVVDPPRTGLGAEMTALLTEIAAPALVYVSCDPATLARDLRVLVGAGYAIENLTLADLFPQTFHIESVVQLRRA